MKYLNDINKSLTGDDSVSFDESTNVYIVTHNEEKITFSDEFFEDILNFHGINPQDIVSECLGILDGNSSEVGTKNDE